MPMTTLALRVIKYLGPRINLGAVADVIPVGASRDEPASSYLRALVLPIVTEDDTSEPLTVSVEPGNYLVKATLPSGEILTQEIDAAGPERVSVDLFSEDSPHEWLSKQQLSGAVPSSRMVKLSRTLGVVPGLEEFFPNGLWRSFLISTFSYAYWLTSFYPLSALHTRHPIV